MLFFWLSAFLIYFLDRFTKVLILKWEGTFYPLTSFLNLVKFWNKGIVFGLLNETLVPLQFLLTIVNFVVLVVVYLWAKTSDPFTRIPLGILLGAGLGNLTDRILYSAVLDFIDFHIKGYHWPAFNVADAGITISLIILAIKLFRKN